MKSKGLYEFASRIGMLILCVICSMSALAFKLPNPEVEIDDIRYMLDYHRYKYYHSYAPPIGWGIVHDDVCTWEYRRIVEVQRVNDMSFHFQRESYNGVERTFIGMFIDHDNTFPNGDRYYKQLEYVTYVMKPNTPYRENFPDYDPKKDEMLQKKPYYTGNVWIQDSVLLPALPNRHKQKYYYVLDFDEDIFNEELISLRTPRFFNLDHSAKTSKVFNNCTGLKTLQIGSDSSGATVLPQCPALETLIYENPRNMQEMIWDSSSLKYIVLKTEVLPYLEISSSWKYGDFFERVTLYVHKDLVEKCKRNIKGWGKFMNIKTLEEFDSGVDNIIDNAPLSYEVYDISGKWIKSTKDESTWREGLPQGIYIVKCSNGNVRKYFIK